MALWRYLWCLWPLWLCPVGPVPAAEGAVTYVVGVVPQFEARRLHAVWRPILDALQLRTGYRFRLRGSPTIAAFETEYLAGGFDFAYMNPYHVMLTARDATYLPLVRDHGSSLYGVLVVRDDSGIRRVEELAGRPVAFPAPNALGASLMIRQALQDRFGIRVQPRYVKSHDSVYLNVALGRTLAGGGVQKTLERQRPELRDSLRVLFTTLSVAPHPFAAHARVPGEVRTRVRNALLALGQASEGRALLARVPIQQVGEADLEDYLPLAELGLERFYSRGAE